MKTYVIERDLPGIGRLPEQDLSAAAAASNAALARLAPRIQWQYSYLAGDKSFCVYLAQDAHAIREHAERSGFPATRVTRIFGRIDPTTAADPDAEPG